MIHAHRSQFEHKDVATAVWSIIDSPLVTEIIATSGVDAIFFDLEHGQFNTSSLADCIRVASPYCTPFVRLPKVDRELTQKVLDLGAGGIILPQITSIQQLDEACAAIKLAPQGTRGFNPFTRAGNYLGNAATSAFQPGAATIVPIIETVEAVEMIDYIVAIHGVDIIYVGVYDLSCAFGAPGEVDHPRVRAASDLVRACVKAAGKRVAYMVDFLKAENSGERSMQVLRPDTFLLKQAIVSRILKHP